MPFLNSNWEVESRGQAAQTVASSVAVLPGVPSIVCGYEFRTRPRDTTANHCSRRRICVTSLTCVNGCAIVFSAARKSLPSRLTSRLLHPCSPHISTPSNRPPIPAQKKKAAGNRPLPPPASLSLNRNPGHVHVLVPFALLLHRPLMLQPSTPRPRIRHPPMFRTRSLTPSTLPHPAKPHPAPVVAGVVADAVAAQAVDANKPLRKPSPPKESLPRFLQKRTILRNSASLPSPLCLPCHSRRGHPHRPLSRNALRRALLFLPSACPVPARVPGSSVTTWPRCRAT